MQTAATMQMWEYDYDWTPDRHDNIICVFSNRKKELPAIRVFLMPEVVVRKLNLMDQVISWKSLPTYIDYGTREYYEGYYLAHLFKTNGIEINLNQIACFGFEHMIQVFVNDG